MKKGFLRILCFAMLLFCGLQTVGFCKQMSDQQTSIVKNDEAKDRELFDAVRDNDLEKVKELIANGADVNAKDRWVYTPLHLVNDVEIAKVLIANGADVNARFNDGSTPLHHAKNADIARL